MWTKLYKGYYIHGYFNKDDCQVMTENTETTFGIIYCKSFRAAQMAVTKHIKEQSK